MLEAGDIIMLSNEQAEALNAWAKEHEEVLRGICTAFSVGFAPDFWYEYSARVPKG